MPSRNEKMQSLERSGEAITSRGTCYCKNPELCQTKPAGKTPKASSGCRERKRQTDRQTERARMKEDTLDTVA